MENREEKTRKLFDIITTVVLIIFLIFIYVKFVYF
jgi:hypothetical protein